MSIHFEQTKQKTTIWHISIDISNHFSPYTLNYSIKVAKPNANNIKDNNKFTIKNFNRVFHSGVSVPRNVYISNGCYIG